MRNLAGAVRFVLKKLAEWDYWAPPVLWDKAFAGYSIKKLETPDHRRHARDRGRRSADHPRRRDDRRISSALGTNQFDSRSMYPEFADRDAVGEWRKKLALSGKRFA
jgi:hypothetical protein